MGLAKRGFAGSLAAMFKVVITDYIAPPVEPEETIFAGLAKVEPAPQADVAPKKEENLDKANEKLGGMLGD